MFVRRELILLVEVWLKDWGDQPGPGWTAGPLQRSWRVGKPDQLESNAESRLAYTNLRLKEPLYAQTVRRHRLLNETLTLGAGGKWTATALEIARVSDQVQQLVPEGGPQAVAIFHGELDAPNAGILFESHQEVLKINPAIVQKTEKPSAMALIEQVLGENAKLSKKARQVATSITFVTEDTGLGALPGYNNSFPNWTITDQWLWHLSRGQKLMPDPSGLSEFRKEQVVMDGALRALVTYRGLVLVGVNSDTSPDHGYYQGTEFQVHTLYTDAMTLGMLQRLLVRQLPAQISGDLSKNVADQQTLSTLKHNLLVMRDEYWSVDFGHRGAMDTFLKRFQKAYDMRRSLDSAFEDMDDHLAELQVSTSQGTNALLTLLAVIGLPLTIGATAWASWATASGWDYSKWIWLGLVIIVTVIVFVLISVQYQLLRQSLKALYSGSIKRKATQ